MKAANRENTARQQMKLFYTSIDRKSRATNKFLISADELAAQLTLIDLPIFKAITRDEVTNLGSWSIGKRHELAPNIVAMNKQFNQVTFWIVGQILSQETPRARCDVICHFIQTASKLLQLNNLHSACAVVSALYTTPIFRLERTCRVMEKKFLKQKLQLDELLTLFSDTNNYELLRKHISTTSLPCIPYLGMYSRDIIYINEAHQRGTNQIDNTSKILDLIEKFQQSTYDGLEVIPEIQHYLIASHNIDELQKFVEDENYRRSFELEPPGHHQVSSVSPNFLTHKKLSTVGTTSLLLAGLTSIVHSAVFKSAKLASARRSPTHTKDQRYLIDDSFV